MIKKLCDFHKSDNTQFRQQTEYNLKSVSYDRYKQLKTKLFKLELFIIYLGVTSYYGLGTMDNRASWKR